MVENNYVEFKRELNDKLEKEVVAFLNSNGGNIYIGINDDGTTNGVENIDKIQLLIKNRIIDKISPSVIGFFEIINERKDGKDIIHIIIASGNEKPYYIKKYGMSPEGAYIRVGSSCVQLNEKQIFNMFSKRTRTSLINIISPTQKLTFKQLKIYYEEVGYVLTDNYYNQLNLKQENEEYNYLAYLLSDQNSLVINVGKFKGDSVSVLEEMNSYSNQSLIKTTFEILSKIESYKKTYTKIASPKRIEIDSFDSIAMREAVINAIVHSDYSYGNTPTFRIFDEKIDIISVGGLPEGIEKSEFLSGYMSPKNPQLMKVFRDLRLVEHMGTGITRILDKYNSNIFEFSDNFIKVSFPLKKIVNIDLEEEKNIVNKAVLSDREKQIINLIKNNNKITQEEIANFLSVSRYTIIRELKKLEEIKMIERIGSNKSGIWEVLKNKN